MSGIRSEIQPEIGGNLVLHEAGSGRDRFWILVSAVAYAVFLHWAHAHYLSDKWGYYGFRYDNFNGADWAAVLVLTLAGAARLPKALDRPSSVIIWQLFVIVYLPIVTITVGLSADSLARYGWSLAALGVGFLTICSTMKPGVSMVNREGWLPSADINAWALALWVIATAALIFLYRDIIAFAALDDIYYQRSLTSAEVGSAVAYLRTYYSSLLCPFLLIVGAMQRRLFLIGCALVGFAVTYGIDAQKITVVTMAAVLGLFAAYRIARIWYSSAVVLAVVMAPMVILVLLYIIGGGHVYLPGGQTTLDIVVFRMVALPGLSFSQYYDIFTSTGYTYWSNVRGIGLIVSPPAAFINDPWWPNLGNIVGDRFYGNTATNANANPFAGEGVAAAGPLGVIVISVATAIWLRVLDWAAQGWSSIFVSLLVVSIGMTLTNGHLSTLLISFGGALLPILLFALGPRTRLGNKLHGRSVSL